jgi:tripartite-type tricarboxylate transporter receptor subunit TctC
MSKERSRVLPNLPTTLELGTDVQTYAWIDLPAQPCRLAVQQEINDASAAPR